MKIIHLPDTDPYLNLAIEEHFLRDRDDDDYLLLWRNDNTIVVGLHQNTGEEINSAFVEERGIRVVRRRTGGGAVYHDLGNLNFSFITGAVGAEQMTMRRFTQPVARALEEMGLHAEAVGRNDILAEGRKVSGNAQTLHKQRILHHGTLLFDSDLSVLSQALKVKPEKFLSKSVKSVRARVGNIAELLPEELRGMSMEAFRDRVALSFARAGKAETLELEAAVLEAAQCLAADKYRTWEWNFGRSPQFTFRNQEKYPGGFLEVWLNVRQGVIQACGFYGDFMALRPAAELAEQLRGLRHERGAVAAALDNLTGKTAPLSEYFGSITRDEILHCMFG
ncbi:MAG: lipoate--protein ligase [Deltaproteobacteria bacterium]|jgi:lipoate-protein ligase A|nr:lipoate--protein ligase [Deltaproteobacteria bacterium]